MRAIIFGGDGNLGKKMSQYLSSLDVQIFHTTIDKNLANDQNNWFHFDLSGDVDDFVLPSNIDVAFIFAAITSMQACEQFPTLTRKINVDNTIKLINKLQRENAFIVFPSSNQVFNGKTVGVLSTQETSPLTEYGRQKVEVENHILALACQAVIVRLTKVITPDIPLFCQWCDALKSDKPIHPFYDMVFSPVPVSLVLRVMKLAAEHGISGIVQLSGAEDITYEQAALYLARSIGADQGLIKSISVKEKNINQQFIPSSTTMDMSRLINEFGINPPNYKAVIDEFLQKRKCN